MTDAVGVLEGMARYDGIQRHVFVRIGTCRDAIYLDLGNKTWEAVEVTSSGWKLVDRPGARFRRPSGLLPLLPPDPEAGSLSSQLRPLINVGDDQTHCLVTAWLLAALRDRGPYPIAVIQGEQGSAKSTLARVLRSLVDPSTAPLRRPPRDEHELTIAANNAWIVAYDNLSGLQPWLSDALCTLATGGGFSARKLYTDSDEVLFDATRPVILNGIDDLLTRADLTDRAVVFSLPQIPERERRDEERLWAEFEAARPRILAALLTCVSTAMRNLREVQLTSSPRMADFARWVIAAESALGWQPGFFLTAYSGNRTEAIELGLDTDLVASAVRELVSEGPWDGTATDLQETLTERAPDKLVKGRTGWPKSPRALADRLRRLAPSLRAVGIGITFAREPRTRRRLISIRTNHAIGTDISVPNVPGDQRPINTATHGTHVDAPGQLGDVPRPHESAEGMKGADHDGVDTETDDRSRADPTDEREQGVL